jgi:hypothetical protein
MYALAVVSRAVLSRTLQSNRENGPSNGVRERKGESESLTAYKPHKPRNDRIAQGRLRLKTDNSQSKVQLYGGGRLLGWRKKEGYRTRDTLVLILSTPFYVLK